MRRESLVAIMTDSTIPRGFVLAGPVRNLPAKGWRRGRPQGFYELSFPGAGIDPAEHRLTRPSVVRVGIPSPD